MDKKCIFNNEKNCENCGECNICDLDKSKICDSCGKCLGKAEDKEYRTLAVDTILDEDYSDDKIDFENEDIASLVDEFSNESNNKEKVSIEYTEQVEQDEWILIDDIPGLKEMLEENEIPKGYTEEFPGLMVFKNKD